jgi:uroporphyrin-III C-methyltransferase / precorrin-2 dehydrogenase / sirohydrochlorin ferrochelatase
MTMHAKIARKPRETQTPRLGDLATLPVFFKLSGRTVLLAGGDAGASWKAELLSSAGAIVSVMTPTPSSEMLSLASERPERVILQLRPWFIGDFAGKSLAIGAIGAEEEARAFRCGAKAAGVPVNLVDRPALCDFAFGSIVNRSPLVIGISTDGAAPVFGQAIRMRIEQMLPMALQNWAGAAKAWRMRIEAKHWPFRQRRLFWEAFSRLALAEPDRIPSLQDEAHCYEAAEGRAERRGRVSFVGAGPGDPALLTLKAMRLMQSADVILHDDLVSSAVLDMARREARKIAVGKRGERPSCPQEEISRLIVDLVCEGQHVVRLKGGDCGIFGRLDEELAATRAAGIVPEIVPGISAAQGAAAEAGFSLTRRGAASRLQFVAGQSAQGGLPEGISFAALADPQASTCIYMGRRTLPELAERLMAQGLPGETPVLLAAQATRAEASSCATSLADCAGALADLPLDAPLMVMIGAAFAPHAAEQAMPLKAAVAASRLCKV